LDPLALVRRVLGHRGAFWQHVAGIDLEAGTVEDVDPALLCLWHRFHVLSCDDRQPWFRRRPHGKRFSDEAHRTPGGVIAMRPCHCYQAASSTWTNADGRKTVRASRSSARIVSMLRMNWSLIVS